MCGKNVNEFNKLKAARPRGLALTRISFLSVPNDEPIKSFIFIYIYI